MPSGVTIRPLADYQEMKLAVEFQRVIWGSSFNEIVPAVVFWAAYRTGGIVAGAFDRRGAMLGLIFGITGWDGQQPLHWSDMLGVHPDARGRGIALALKQYQRIRLLEAGVTLVQWTFDPLEARNAHINFARLGATAREYIRDCYGASTSPLHRGIGTDRLVAEWRLDSPRVRQRMDDVAAGAGVGGGRLEGEPHGSGEDDGAGSDEGEGLTGDDALLINPQGEGLRLDLDAPRLLLRIPPDIQALKQSDAVAARRWREQTRAALERYLARGYEVRDLVRGRDGSRYVLSSS